jgi:hypothetical protein
MQVYAIKVIKHSKTLHVGGAAVNVKLKGSVGTSSMCRKCAKRVPTSDTRINLEVRLANSSKIAHQQQR